MFILSVLPILLATSAFATPSRRSVPASALKLPAGQTQLVAPPDAPSFVAVGVGFQNYSCSQTGEFVKSGVLANLFDITGLFPNSEFSTIQKDVHSDWVAFQSTNALDPVFAGQTESKYGIKLSGQHYFAGGNQVWDYTSSGPTAGNPDAIVTGQVTGTIKAPTGGLDIDWLQVTGTSGKLAKTIFRVDTVGGERAVPDSCGSGPGDSAKFTAVFWLYGSQL